MVEYVTELFYSGVWHDITADIRDADPIKISRGRKDWAATTDPATLGLRLNNGHSNYRSTSVFEGFEDSDLDITVTDGGDAAWERTLFFPAHSGLFSFQSGSISDDESSDAIIDVPAGTSTVRFWYNVSSEADFDLFVLLIDDRQALTASGETGWTDSGDINVAGAETITLRYVKDGSVSEGDDAAWVDDFSFTGAIYDPGGGVIGRYSPRNPRSDLYGLIGRNTPVRVSRPLVSEGFEDSDLDIDISAASPDWERTEVDAYTGAWSFGNVEGGPDDAFTVTAPEAATGMRWWWKHDTSFTSFIASIDGVEQARTDPDDTGWHEAAIPVDPGDEVVFHQTGFDSFIDDIEFTVARFAGEATAWPVRWPLSGGEAGWVPFTASGILRRLQRGNKPLKSSLFRDLSTAPDVVAYWPLEEPDGADRFRAGRTGDDSTLFPLVNADVSFAADSDTFFASAALPTFSQGPVEGNLPAYEGAADQRFFFLIGVGDDGFDDDVRVLELKTTGSVDTWQITITSGGGTNLEAFSEGSTVASESNSLSFVGDPSVMSLWLQQDGSDVFWQVAKFPLDTSVPLVFEDTISGEDYGRFSRVSLGSAADMADTTIGHVAVLNDDVDSVWDTIGNSLQGWSGETGFERLVRLSADEGLPAVALRGDGDETESMGPQRMVPLVELFREVATTDLGILGDFTGAVGIEYRTRADLYSQEAALVLDYSDGLIAAPFEPVADDQATRNQVTVNRVRGSSFTAEETEGPLSTAAPPDGVGKYDITQEVNLDDDTRLADHAYWRLHLGTVDEIRFPTLRLNLRNPRVAEMVDDILAVTEGDLIRIDNPPEWMPTGPYLLIVEGSTEEKTAATHTIEFNCSPGSAWDALMLDDDDFSRLDTGGSELIDDVSLSQTTFRVATTGTQRWIDDAEFAGQFPFDVIVGGEVMRVTGVSGTGSQQDFTVTRGVGGVAFAHNAGADLRLSRPARLAL